MEWLREHFPLASTLLGILTTAGGGILALYRVLAARVDEKMSAAVSVAVKEAVQEIMQDFSQVRERVAALEAHFMDSKEDIQEIKGKLDTLGGHVLQLPDRLAEVLKK